MAAPRATFADASALLFARVVSTSGPALLAAWRRSFDEGGVVFVAPLERAARQLAADAVVVALAALVFAMAAPRARTNALALAVTPWSRWVTVLMAEALWNATRGGGSSGAVHRGVEAAALVASAMSVVAIVRALRTEATAEPHVGRSVGALGVGALGVGALGVGALWMAACVAVSALQVAKAMPTLASPRGPARGAAAPGFVVPLLGGGTFRLDAARGRPVLIDFWATWCDACVESMPALEAIRAHRRERVDVVAIEIEAAREEAERLVEGQRWSVPIGLGDAALATRYGVRSLPHLVLVDARGRVALVFRGAYDPAAVEHAIDALEPEGRGRSPGAGPEESVPPP